MCNWCEGGALLYNLEDESGGIGIGVDHNVFVHSLVFTVMGMFVRQ